MLRCNYNGTKNLGLSLVELLVSMTMALTLAGLIMQIYLSQKLAEQTHQARISMQQSAVFALNYIGQEIALAAYLGCFSYKGAQAVHSHIVSSSVTQFLQTPVRGWDAGVSNLNSNAALLSTQGGAWQSGGITSDLISLKSVPNSDILQLWATSASVGSISQIYSTSSIELSQANSSSKEINRGDVLLASDCITAHWLQVCEIKSSPQGIVLEFVSSGSCYPGNDLEHDMTSLVSGEVHRLNSTLFYIGKRGNSAKNPPALFRRSIDPLTGKSRAQELVEGVQSMQFVYGVNLDEDDCNSVDAYLHADQINKWSQVISVKVSLLM